MYFYRDLEPGDSIASQGMRFEIKEILFQDCYNCEWDESRSYVDIEFKDPNGGYHHCKSNLDGGQVIWNRKTSVTLSSILSKLEMSKIARYYDKGTGRFFIPFSEMSADLTDIALKLISKGYALSAYFNGYENVYTVFNLMYDCKGYRNISATKDILYAWLHDDCGCHYFTTMSIDEYFSNQMYQKAVDYVLLRYSLTQGTVDGYSIVMKSDGKNLIFVEARECFE